MLKRIALAAVVVVSAAFAGVGAAKAHSGAAKKVTAPSVDAPRGFPCAPGGCSEIVKPAPPQGFNCFPGMRC